MIVVKNKINSICILFILLLTLFNADCQSVQQKDALLRTEEPVLLKSQPNINTGLFRILPGDVLELMFQIKQGQIKKYTIQTNDDIEIVFPSIPSFNSIQKVRPDGCISLYQVEDILITNLTLKDATEKIKQAYRDILWEPDIYLTVKNFGGNIAELKNVISSFERGQNKLITVRMDGFASFPLIGEIDIKGATLKETQDLLNKEYRKMYPEVYVDLFYHESTGRNVTVLGEVNKVGVFPLTTSQTILEIVAHAGGFTENAVLSNVILLKKRDGVLKGFRINVKKLLKENPQFLSDGVEIEPGDTIFVPKYKISNIAYFVNKFSQSILFRGMGVNFSKDIG